MADDSPLSPASTSAAPEVENDDTLDFFEDSLGSLFNEHMPAAGDPLKLYTYTPPGGALPLTCRIPPQQVNSLFAHHVWSASLRMADALSERRLVVEGEDVLEMGAGAGIPGLVAARMGARRIVLSDYDDTALIANLKANVSLAYPDAPETRSRLKAVGHSWGEEPSLQALLSANDSSSFTHILLADTLWYSDGHSLLLSSLVRLLAHTPTARIHICAGFHSGRATVRNFLRKARAVGLVPRGAWEEVGVKGERREWGWDVRRAAAAGAEGAGEAGDAEDQWIEEEDTSERNKWVVEGSLGWGNDLLREADGREGIADER
ncbi:hypothetical protein JCM10207_004330 [Rhodosporidiobolus poonsookiae]